MEIRVISNLVEQMFFLNKAPLVRCELVTTKNNISYITDDVNLLEHYRKHPEIKLTNIGAGNYCVSYSEDRLEEQFFIDASNLKQFLESTHIPWKIHNQNGVMIMEEW
jgi:hypothetical protein